MRIPEPLLRCSVFLGVYRKDKGGAPECHGTGFLVSLLQDGTTFAYIVTAKHLAEGINEFTKRYPGSSFVRLNDATGAAFQVSLRGSYWQVSSDAMVDVAVCPIELPNQGRCFVPTSSFVSSSQFAEFGIGLGDEVFTIGLLSFVASDKYNEPVVRYGTLAMLPREPIATKWGNREVYLVEARSIGGLSGSPVFVRETLWLNPEACYRLGDTYEETPPMLTLGRTFLLGVMRGHWDVDPDTIGSAHPTEKPSNQGGVNYGLAMVTPATKILDILNAPALAAEREERCKLVANERPKQNAP